MNEYIAMWKNYANFTDRTSVRGYWMAFLFNFLASFVLSIIAQFVPQLAFLTSIYALATLVPGLAIAVRRLRDAGKNWTSIFFGLIPIVGVIILIVFMCKPTVSAEGNQV